MGPTCPVAASSTAVRLRTPANRIMFCHAVATARRLVEKGVRFVCAVSGGGTGITQWDAHEDIEENPPRMAARMDQPVAALLKDLKRRGLLDSTLVVWGGEFGRTPMSQGGDGRDHHIKGFSFLVAGGGIKGGITYGSTDDFGYAAQENPVAVPDFHATMLHLLGIDHKRFTVKFQGMDARLTGISGQVVSDILA